MAKVDDDGGDLRLSKLIEQLEELHAGGSLGFADDTLARHFAKKHGADLRYVAEWAQWFYWDDKRWLRENTLLVYDLARRLLRAAATAANTGAKALASAHTVNAVVSLARTDRDIAAVIGQWDTDPWLLNTPGGVVNLKTGDVGLPDRGQYMTRITSVAPQRMPTPLWSAFLDTVTDGDIQLIAYLQRMAGYCITGSTVEQSLFFLYGLGRNGKGVFTSTLAQILADYHSAAPLDMLIAKKQENHPTELAGLMGRRLVTTAETESNRRWAEAKIKQVTGGDTLHARFMRGDFFDYTPTFKLLNSGNHKPVLLGVGVAMRRRVNLVPFTVTIPEERCDPYLAEKLVAEHPGILQWAIDGCLEWRTHGLAAPKCVVEATDKYFAEQNTLRTWLIECSVEDPQCETLAATLFGSWKEWCLANGEVVGSQKAFSQRLQEVGPAEGITWRDGRKGILYRGRRLAS